MACFLAAAAEAVAVTAVQKAEKKKEEKKAELDQNTDSTEEVRIPLSRKLKWLSRMLWGGTILLIFEHIWHGELVPWFPFLTAMSDPADAAEMVREIFTVGVCMAALITAVWIAMCFAADALVKRSEKSPLKTTAE